MKFSIIIPVYNVAPYLRACLDSVLAAVGRLEEGNWSEEREVGERMNKLHSPTPTFNFNSLVEIICVDDGSTDGSGEILDEYWEKVERRGGGGRKVMGKGSDPLPERCSFRVIHQQNQGVSAARNAALDIATGEWVFFLDGDDLIPADTLMEIDERMDKFSKVDSIGICMYKDCWRDEMRVLRQSLADIVVTGDQILGSDDAVISSYRWLALDKFYRREVIERLCLRFKVGLRVGEDVQFVQLFLAQCGNVLLCLSLMGYEYRTREQSVMERRYDLLVHDPLDRFTQLHKIWKQERRPGLLRLLVKLASETVSYGKEKIYSKNVRGKAIRLLVESKVFNDDVMNFLIMHGTAKGRIFAVIYKILPRFGRRKLLEVL